jgi:hypothetical protein
MSNNYYSDDVKASAKADDNENPDDWKETAEDPVTTGEMNLGDMDDDMHEKDGTVEDVDGDPSEDETYYEEDKD